ncbi:DEAD/DEAH box helicase [Bacteriovoracaceae bacterium]|nr:DEAD/DEAH box helicase [Bacteriovoracaceae bacterium]
MSEITFKGLNLNTDVLRAIDEMGFSTPTEIQASAIPLLMETTKDFIGQAQTGTGKTAAFVIPLLEKIDFSNPNVQALILSPTRELANQIELEIKKLGKYTAAKSTCVYGGTGYESQVRALKRDLPQIVVGTPGRVIDLMKKKILKVDQASYCVLDEADEMLNMGFFEDVQIILDLFNKQRQLIMFSATMPRPILKLIDKSFDAYELVQIAKKSLSNADIEQKYFMVKPRYFKEALSRLLDTTPKHYAIVFCRTKIETKEVGDDLKKRGYSVEVLNGDMGQTERDHAMRKFKERKVNIMVCTDVAARGIDVTCLTHVFNYGLPQDNESYVHRIGRTGRAGEKGKAYTIVSGKNAFTMKRLERHINGKIEIGVLPTIEGLKLNIVENEMKTASSILEAIQSKDGEFKIDDSFSIFSETFSELGKEDLLKLMFTWKFNKALRAYNNMASIEDKASGSGGGGARSGGRGRGGFRAGGRSGGSRSASRSGSRTGTRSGSRNSSRSDRSSNDRGGSERRASSGASSSGGAARRARRSASDASRSSDSSSRVR